MIQTAKPFFSLMICICFMYGSVAFYVIVLLYFLFFGRQIVKLLDSSCLYAFYRSYRQTKSIVFMIFFCNTIIWLISDMPHILEIFKTLQFYRYLIKMVCLYVISTLSYSVIFGIFYYQYATKVALSQIENSLKINDCKIGKLF